MVSGSVTKGSRWALISSKIESFSNRANDAGLFESRLSISFHWEPTLKRSIFDAGHTYRTPSAVRNGMARPECEIGADLLALPAAKPRFPGWLRFWFDGECGASFGRFFFDGMLRAYALIHARFKGNNGWLIERPIMTEPSQQISKAEILCQFPAISARQLERWQRSHLIDPPVQTHRPGLRGSQSLYPARVLQQVADLYNASCRDGRNTPKRVRVSYRQSEKMFVLFWEGRDVLVPDPHAVVRSALSAIAKLRANFGAQDRVEDESSADELATVIDEDEYAGDRALRLVEEHIKGHEDEVRQKIPLGRMSNADVTSFTYAVAGLFFGSLVADEGIEKPNEGPTYADLLFRGYGLAGSRDHPSPFSPVRDTNERASFFNDARDRVELLLSESFLTSLSIEQLRQARTDVRRFIGDFESLGNFLSRFVGRKAFGLAAQAKRLASASVGERAIFVLFFAHAREAMPDNYMGLLDGVGRNARELRDAVRTLKNLSPKEQASMRAAMRLAMRSGSRVVQPSVPALGETRNVSP